MSLKRVEYIFTPNKPYIKRTLNCAITDNRREAIRTGISAKTLWFTLIQRSWPRRFVVSHFALSGAVRANVSTDFIDE